MLKNASRAGEFPGLKSNSKFKASTWLVIPLGTKAAFVAARCLPRALVSCKVEVPAGGDGGAKAVGGDSSDDAPCGGASLAGVVVSLIDEVLGGGGRGPATDTKSESLGAAAAPEDLLPPRAKEEPRSCGDAPMPTAFDPASPPAVGASTMPGASPCAGSEAPAPAGLAITPFGAASLAGKARATEATSSDHLKGLPVLNLETFVLSPPPRVEQFVPNGVGSEGGKRERGDLEEAGGRKKSKANAGDDGAPPIKEDPATQVLPTTSQPPEVNYWTVLENGERGPPSD
jgi:hypothetical protein